MKIAVFSDLHLGIPNKTDQGSATYNFFIQTLKKLREQKITHLWFLGDILDLFVGNFELWTKLYGSLFVELSKLKEQGCEILWCEGNHDFSIKKFLRQYGMETFDGEKRIQLAHWNIYLAHGDLVNVNDEAYLKWRRLTRNPLLRFGLDHLPKKIAENVLYPLALKTSAKSRVRSSTYDGDLKEMYRNFAKDRFKEGIQAVFMGHCHIPDLFITPEGSFYLNLGSWLGNDLRYALWDPEKERFPNFEICPKI